MKELFCELQHLLLAGEDAVLVSILVSSGSAPRGAGARMLVGGAGRICGSIGGGAVEYRSEQLALEAMRERKSFVKEYHLSRDLGMICGGNATVLYQFIAGDDAYMQDLCDAALRLFAAEADIWLITKLVKGIDEINSHRSIHDVREAAKSAIAVEWQMGLAGRDDFSIPFGLTARELQPYLISAPVRFRRNGA
ncbi:MAG: XdhC family protein, partial [Clostridiales bacterium]|nr:XdhC family protein [Clostridiales bacterium]